MIEFPFFSMQQLNLDWVIEKIKGMLSFLPDDGTAGQILRRTADGAEWSDEETGGGGAVDSVNGKTGAVVLGADDILMNDNTSVEDSVSDLKSALYYVTPEMFGAKGDGIADDTNAVIEALNYDSKYVLLKKSYRTTSPVVFKGSYRNLFGCGQIIYTGEQNALTVNGNNLYISVNIRAEFGDGIKIDTSVDQFCQYIKFYDMNITALNKCVVFARDNSKWINEISFLSVRFSGKYGAFFEGENYYDGINFINCADEICTESFIHAYYLRTFSITGGRFQEVPDSANLIEIFGQVDCFYVIGNHVNVDSIAISRHNRSLGFVSGVLYADGGTRIGSSATFYSGLYFLQGNTSATTLTETADVFNYSTYNANALPQTFTLRYVEGGHSYSINLPYIYWSFPDFYIWTQSGLNTLKLLINDTQVAEFTFSGSGYYKILCVNNTYMVDKISS